MGSRNRPQVRALAICFQVLRPEFWAVVPRPQMIIFAKR